MRNHLTSRKRLGAAIGISVAAVMVAGGAAVSIAADESNEGRDPGARPGAPLEAERTPAPAEADDNGGRGAAALPDAQARTESAPAVEAPVDNGRGGVDPAPPIAAETEAARTAASGDVGSHDFDTAPPAEREADRSSVIVESQEAPSIPVDQDVPGAPTGVIEPVVGLPGESGDSDQDG